MWWQVCRGTSRQQAVGGLVLGRVERGCLLIKWCLARGLNEVREMMCGYSEEFLQAMILETRAWLIRLRNSKEGLGAGFSECGQEWELRWETGRGPVHVSWRWQGLCSSSVCVKGSHWEVLNKGGIWGPLMSEKIKSGYSEENRLRGGGGRKEWKTGRLVRGYCCKPDERECS